MGFLSFLKKSRKANKRKKTSGRRTRRAGRPVNSRLKQDIESLQKQIELINIIIFKHDEDILAQSRALAGQQQKMAGLESLVAQVSTKSAGVQPPVAGRPSRLAQSTESAPVFVPGETSRVPAAVKGVDIEKFSAQEKKILSAFFQNPDTPLSYRDIAAGMGKSSNTIKNHMHNILLKADIFDKTVDIDQRNRFRLKDGIKVEKYLNVTQ